MILDEANAELCRHRDRALTMYANQLLRRGLDVDGEDFREKMIGYATDLERWRRDANRRISGVVRAMAERPAATLN